MSYLFRVEDARPLPYADVLDVSSVRCESGTPLSGEWRVGQVHRLYAPGVTTRSIEAILTQGTLNVRIFSGACREDYLLALDLLARVAEQLGTEVLSEEDVRFVPLALGSKYGRGWIDDHTRAIGKLILGMAASKRSDDPVVIPGPMRPFHIGPLTADVVRTVGRSDLERAEVLARMIRQVQYPDLPVVQPRAVTLPDSEQVVAASIITPERAVLVERGDVLGLAAEAPVYVSWGAAASLLGPFARHLDEWTLAVAPVPRREWGQLVAAAAALESDGFESDGELTQHTWWSTQVTDAPTELFQMPVARETDTSDHAGVRQWWDVWRKRR